MGIAGFYASGPAARCTPAQLATYGARISGPLLDRIDLFIEVPRLPVTDIAGSLPVTHSGENAPLSTRDAAARVARARHRQMQRSGCLNGELPQSQLQALARPTRAGRDLLGQVFERLGLTARAYHRVLRVALTIADLEQSDAVEAEHIAEAVQLRRTASAF